jgi:SAM-dependent MidA family methyltransferase
MVIVANEFLDTVPVHVVRVSRGALHEVYVKAAPEGLVQTWGDLSAEAALEIEFLFGALDPRRLETFTADGFLEVFPALGHLMRQVARVMPVGSFVNIDYGEWFRSPTWASEPGSLLRVEQQGGPARPIEQERLGGGWGQPAGEGRPSPEWGAEDRPLRRRTVRGYFKHQVVANVLARPGKQDLTADVDFSAVDLHGREEGFETVLFTTLAAFLQAGGANRELQTLRDEAAAVASCRSDPLEADRQATVLANLLNEGDLGRAFKVMVQVRE